MHSHFLELRCHVLTCDLALVTAWRLWIHQRCFQLNTFMKRSCIFGIHEWVQWQDLALGLHTRGGTTNTTRQCWYFQAFHVHSCGYTKCMNYSVPSSAAASIVIHLIAAIGTTSLVCTPLIAESKPSNPDTINLLAQYYCAALYYIMSSNVQFVSLIFKDSARF